MTEKIVEVVKQIPQERIDDETDIPVPRVKKEILEVVRRIPQERLNNKCLIPLLFHVHDD